MWKFFVAIFFFCSGAFAGDLDAAMQRSAAGMKVQSARMKVVSQNIANADSTGSSADEEPYRRKLITFRNVYDKELGIDIVKVDKISDDMKGKFNAKFDPTHPAADEDGYVLLPNVKKTIENVDIKESERSYEANLGALETTKRMMEGTIELLR